jgi:hypothetical protein
MARIKFIRILLALAAQEGWCIHHMNVKSAFFNGDLKEVYMWRPPWQEGKVLRLRKALYGLQQVSWA